jgi:hypothetical protein
MALTPDEEEELRALVITAMDLRGTGYLRDAVEAIVEWHDRRHLRRYERKQEERARLARLLRETASEAARAPGADEV